MKAAALAREAAEQAFATFVAPAGTCHTAAPDAAARAACDPLGTTTTTFSPTVRPVAFGPTSRTVPAHW